MATESKPADLKALRRQLGAAIYGARLTEAREHKSVLMRIHKAVQRGASFAAAVREHAPVGKLDTLSRWYTRWRQYGLAGLVNGQIGRARKAVRARKTDTRGSAIRPPGKSGRQPLTLLKLPGSKRGIVHELMARMPPRFNRYHEPFLGGGALFMTLCPEVAFLSDHNAEFINVYKVARRSPKALLEALARHRNTSDHYYDVRGIHPDSLSPIERAARTLFLNRTCFNGLFRVNRHGLFNVPYGSQQHTTFYYPDLIWRVHAALKRTTLYSGDFELCAEHALAGDFVYLDPPYPYSRGGARPLHYRAGGFDEDEQDRVARLARLLDQRGCLVMISNADCPLTRKLYRGFHIDKITVHRRVGASARDRGGTGEIIARNYEGRRENNRPS